MSDIKRPVYDWCEDREPAHLNDDVHGVDFDIAAEDSSVNTLIHYCDRGSEDGWDITIDIGEWLIHADSSPDLGPEMEREFRNLHAIISAIETRVRAFQAANVGTRIKRETDVVEQMEALADR